MKTVIQLIASKVQARKNCIQSGNDVWKDKHEEALEDIQNRHLPSGSGIDCGCSINLITSTDKKVVIDFSYHHLDEHGGYNGWTLHKAVVTPTFSGIDIRFTGKDKNGVKDYLQDLFQEVLGREVLETVKV